MRKRNRVIVSLAIALAISAFFVPVSVPQDGMNFGMEIHVDMYHYRDGVLLDHSHHPGVLTDLGANFIEQQISGTASTTVAVYIGLSNDATAPTSAWVVLPTEISGSGMGRATGSYVDDGVGAWNVTNTFSVTGTQSAQLTGLYYEAAGDYLLCADQFTQVNAEDGDSLEIVWSLSVAGT